MRLLPPDSLTVFAARESAAALRSTVESARIAADGACRLRVLVNGNPALAAALRASARQWPDVTIDSLPRADKAAAWNYALHACWRGEARMFFCDGYVHLAPDAVQALARALAERPEALAGSGVPSTGRSAPALQAAMATHGGMHGNFCGLTRLAIEAIRARGLRLPTGLYRGEALWRALCCYAFDPATHAWRDERVIVAPQAQWTFAPLRGWRPADWLVAWRRRLRQAQGDLENLAAREHLSLRRLPPEALPGTAFEMIDTWRQRDPRGFRQALQADWKRRRVWRRLREA